MRNFYFTPCLYALLTLNFFYMCYYQVNSAVIKQFFLGCSQSVFIQQALVVRHLFLTTPCTPRSATLFHKFRSLYLWCRSVYRQRFL